MIRAAAAILCAVVTSLPAKAMVGGAQPTNEGAGRAVVMLTGSHGTFCSGVALARELVLTAAHCVLPGADYKLVDEYLKMEKPYDIKTAYTNEFLDKTVKMPPINPPKLY